jgi:hypothetical protein
VGKLGGEEIFFSMLESFFRILSLVVVVRVFWVILSSSRFFFKNSQAFLVNSGQLLAWRKASTVAIALWVWIESAVMGSGLGDVILNGISMKNKLWER